MHVKDVRSVPREGKDVQHSYMERGTCIYLMDRGASINFPCDVQRRVNLLLKHKWQLLRAGGSWGETNTMHDK